MSETQESSINIIRDIVLSTEEAFNDVFSRLISSAINFESANTEICSSINKY